MRQSLHVNKICKDISADDVVVFWSLQQNSARIHGGTDLSNADSTHYNGRSGPERVTLYERHCAMEWKYRRNAQTIPAVLDQSLLHPASQPFLTFCRFPF